MRYFAKIDKNGIVEQVIVADANIIAAREGTWVETFIADPVKEYAGVGDGYSTADQKFKMKPVSDMKFNKTSGSWLPSGELQTKTKIHKGKKIIDLPKKDQEDLLIALCNMLALVDENALII